MIKVEYRHIGKEINLDIEVRADTAEEVIDSLLELATQICETENCAKPEELIAIEPTHVGNNTRH